MISSCFDQYSTVLKLSCFFAMFVFASYSTVRNDKLFLRKVRIWISTV